MGNVFGGHAGPGSYRGEATESTPMVRDTITTEPKKGAERYRPITLPCGTPLITDIGWESELPSLTHWERLDKKSVIHARRLPVSLYAFSLINNLG